MAKQGGIIKLEGTIGDIAFYKTQDGYLAREKGGISADRLKSDPAFQRTRENGDEFGRAGSAGKLLRNAFRQFVQPIGDNRMVSRLTKGMVEVVKADATSTRGQRNVLDGELEMLEGFEFNIDGLFKTTFYAPYVPTIDRVTGALQVAIPPFIPANMVASPDGATHFKLISGGASIDFEGGTFEVVTSESQEIEINPVSAGGKAPAPSPFTLEIDLLNQLTANSVHPLFLILGIEFFQDVNGIRYALKNGRFNSLALVKVLGL
jgi:hypothetical protein